MCCIRDHAVRFCLLLALLAAACSDANQAPLDADSAAGDIAEADLPGDVEADSDDVSDEPVADLPAADAPDEDLGPAPAIPYERAYPSASTFAAPEGSVWRRAIIHLHSTHSHDACDGDPRPDGDYNYPCLADLRDALCTVRVDFAYLTDHRVYMAEPPFEDLLLHDVEAGDALIREDDVVVANRFSCDGGHQVTVTAGMETALMPLFFRGHLDEDVAVRQGILSGKDRAAVDSFRAGGAVVWTAHTEGKSAEELIELDLDGIEIYNLHANIDPTIRTEELGLPSGDILGDLVPFVLQRVDTSPDLSLLAFLEENRPSLDRWATALANRHVVGTAGTDAHQNVLPPPMADGERFDSYRRMMAWFSNYVLAEDESLAAFDAALRAGRLFVAFDTLAAPEGFDFAAFERSGARHEMGDTVALGAGLVLRATIPQPPAVSGHSAEVRALLLRAEAASWETVAEWEAGSQTYPVQEAGIYRVEVHMRPGHLAPYLDPSIRDLADREMPWIYGNPVRVEER